MKQYFEGSYEDKRIAIPIDQIQGIVENTDYTTLIYVTGFKHDCFVVSGSYESIIESIF